MKLALDYEFFEIKIELLQNNIMEEQIAASYGIESDYAIIGKTKYELIKQISKNMLKVREMSNSLAIIVEEYE